MSFGSLSQISLPVSPAITPPMSPLSIRPTMHSSGKGLSIHSRSKLLSHSKSFMHASSDRLAEAFSLLDRMKSSALESGSTEVRRTEVDLLSNTLQRLCIMQSGEQDVLEVLRESHPDAFGRIAMEWFADEYTMNKRAGMISPVSKILKTPFRRHASERMDKRSSLQQANIAPDRLLEVATILEGLDYWTFDTLQLSDRNLTSRPVVLITTSVLQAQRLDEIFSLSSDKLARYLSDVDEAYYNNPYHNKWHAADVVQGTHFYLIEVLKDLTISNEYKLAAILAAAVHDLGHLGVNNHFLVSMSHPLALRYNDISPLENMHCSKAFELMDLPGRQIMQSMERSVRQSIRSCMVSMILNTDNAKHTEVLNRLDKLCASSTFNLTDPSHQRALLEVTLHSVDVSNAARSWPTYRKWGSRIISEFYAQGDAERDSKLPVTPIMDRANPIPVPVLQVGFMNAIVSPVLATLQQVQGVNVSIPLAQLNFNLSSMQMVIDGEYTLEELDEQLGFIPDPQSEAPNVRVELGLYALEGNVIDSRLSDAATDRSSVYSSHPFGEEDVYPLSTKSARSVAAVGRRLFKRSQSDQHEDTSGLEHSQILVHTNAMLTDPSPITIRNLRAFSTPENGSVERVDTNEDSLEEQESTEVI